MKMKFDTAGIFLNRRKYPETFKYFKGPVDKLKVNTMRIVFDILCGKALIYAAIFDMDGSFPHQGRNKG